MEQQFTPQSDNRQRKSFMQRNRLSIKISLIGALILLLLIPVSMVENLIQEREITASSAIHEVQDKWSKAQNIIGPILTIPYYDKIQETSADGKEVKIKNVMNRLHILPETLEISGDVQTSELKRGLYEIVVYNAPVELKGKFILPEELSDKFNIKDLSLDNAVVNIGLSDLRGISEQVEMQWNGKTLVFNPANADNGLSGYSISTLVPTDSLFSSPSHTVEFSIKFRIKGSESIRFAPLGKTTSVQLTSNCTTPSFTGAFLPESREVTESGFKSNWQILYLNRNYPQILEGNRSVSYIEESTFGADLLLPVQQYQKSMRSIKYAFLIIILTFVVSFFAEIMQKKNIHPFQYLLVGLALCIFYILLVSISEHLNFTLSYFISAFMTVIMLTCYMLGVLKIRKTAFTIGALLTALYIYIFILIQMEIYALLAGSIGLFLILGTIMYYSQKINWNNNQES